MIQIRLQDFKQFRIKSNHSIRSFANYSGLSGTLIQKIEKCEYVNLRSIERYLITLGRVTGERYLFIHEPKKTTQKD